MALKDRNINKVNEDILLEQDGVVSSSNSQAISSMSTVNGKDGKKKRKGLLFLALIFVLIILLTITLRLVFPEGDAIAEISVKFMFDSDIDLVIKSESSAEDRYVLLPGDRIPATITFWLEGNDLTDYSQNNSVFVRARIYGVLDDEKYWDIFQYTLDDEYWIQSVNNYYYYNNIVRLKTNEDDKQKLQTEIHITESLDNRFNGREMELRIEFSVLQAEYQAIGDIWKDSPYQWREDIRNKYFNN